MKFVLMIGVSTAALAASATGSFAQATSGATAASTVTEVIVTAERRSVTLQKAPLAVTVVDGAKIDQKGLTSYAQVLSSAPSVILQGAEGGVSTQSATGGGGPPNIAIRGLGTDGPNKNSAVAVYEDGVLMGGGGASFYDVSRVEVLRGPQGTLYGRGATAGTVNIITRDPTNEFELAGRLQYGNYNTANAQLVANVPLSDKLALRVGANSMRHDGYFSSGQSGDNEVNTRAKIAYSPSETLHVLIGGEYYHADRTNAGTVTLSAAAPDPTDWVTTEPAGGTNRITYKKVFGHVDWDLGRVTLTYIPSFQRNESSNVAYISPGRVTSVSPYDRTRTQELRLAGGAGSRLTWIAGAFDYANKYEYTLYAAAPTTSGGVAGYNTTTRRTQNFDQSSFALFGDATYALSDTLRVTGGVRQNWDKVLHTEDNLTASGPGTNYFKKNYKAFNWKARIEADLSSTSLVYAMASTGYRPGGSQTNQSYEPEKVDAWEVGSKNRFGWLTLNASVFHYKYSGFQTPQSYGVFPNLSFTIVAVPATFYGGEVELTASPTPNDTFTLSPTYLHGRFTGNYEYTDPLTSIHSSLSLKGATVPHQPKWSLNASYEHRFVLDSGAAIIAGVDAHYQDQQFTDFDLSIYNGTNNRIFRQGAYTVWNASVNYQPADSKWGLGAYWKNIGNQIYKISTTGPRTYINDPGTAGVFLSFKY